MPVSPTRDNAAQQWALPEVYARLQDGFNWQVPEHFNMAQVCCTRWATQPNATENIAINTYQTGTTGTFYTYFQLQRDANRLSN
ncbi:AMP-binding protein, partial [bacterium]|nr:AMP-binding protein [bacterium]